VSCPSPAELRNVPNYDGYLASPEGVVYGLNEVVPGSYILLTPFLNPSRYLYVVLERRQSRAPGPAPRHRGGLLGPGGEVGNFV
jgi:hypothetical protein